MSNLTLGRSRELLFVQGHLLLREGRSRHRMSQLRDWQRVMKPNEICVNGHEWNLFELNSFRETEKIASPSQAKNRTCNRGFRTESCFAFVAHWYWRSFSSSGKKNKQKTKTKMNWILWEMNDWTPLKVLCTVKMASDFPDGKICETR